MAIYLDSERDEGAVVPPSGQPNNPDEAAQLRNWIAIGVERFVDAFLRPPTTLHASLFIQCGDYWRRACSCGYVSGPHVSESAAYAEPCPREAADILHRLRLGQDQDEILAGLRALAAVK